MEFVTTPKEELRYASESISQSIALGINRLSHYGERLTALLPELIHAFKQTTVENAPKIEPLKGDQKTFLKKLSDHSYAELRNIEAFVPEGMHGTYLDLMKVLEGAADRCIQIEAQVLAPYVLFLGQLVSSTDALKSMDDHSQRNAQLQANRTAVYQHIGQSFEAKYDARAKLGTVIERNADWEEVFSCLNSLTSKMESVDRKKIDALVRQAEDYLNVILEKAKKGDLTQINPEVCKALADGAYEIASEVEFISVIYYRVLAVKGSIENTMAELQRVLNS